MPGLLLAALVWLHRDELVDHRVKVRAAAGGHATTPDTVALPAARDPALHGLFRPVVGQHHGHPAIRRAGLGQHGSASAKTTPPSA